MPKGEYLQYGGQAVVEGVMMRSPNFFAVAVRAPNGEIVLHSESHEKSWLGRQSWIKWPLLRGAYGLIDGMVLGYKSLRFASNVQLDPRYQNEDEDTQVAESDAPKPDPSTDGKGGEEPQKVSTIRDVSPHKGGAGHKSGDTFSNMTVGIAMIAGLAIGLLIFNFLPNYLGALSKSAGVTNGTLINLITEIIKVIFFIGYLALIAQLPEIREIFKYHGAEHKAINVIENGLELTNENVQKQTRLHPRCGTSFAIVVLILGMILFTFMPKPDVGNRFLTGIVRFLVEIPLLPVLAAVAYELIRFAGRMRNSSFVRALFWPGLMTQYITTKEPRDDQVEVAMVALKAVLDLERDREEMAASTAIAATA